VKTLLWSEEKGKHLRLLVCCDGGGMMEVEPPDAEEYDTTKSYHLDQLEFTTRTFVSIKDRLRVSMRSKFGRFGVDL